jgi:UDP-N-acetylmuramoylalanine-D-glutamate ligase
MLYKLKNFSFDYSILTNIETDHLDWHHNKADYTTAKLQIIHLTKKQAFTTEKVYDILDPTAKKKTTIFGYDYDLTGTKFVGHHNKANLQSVYMVISKMAKDINLNTTDLEIIIANVTPLEHRMQLHSTINNIAIYDDAICTSAHAQENALK